jgi:transcriptional regulator with GAF, ATPase, and Fis domain
VLSVIEGPDRGRSIDLYPGRVTVGRGEDNDLRLTDHQVSRRHCELEVTRETVRLCDTSRNGTFVNGVRISVVTLEPGMKVRLGDTLLAFRERVEEDAAKADSFGDLVGTSVAMRDALATLRCIAPTRLTCLLQGETGTGKELAARALHERSTYGAGPLVVIDCGAVSESLIEDKLFGHERGAFTGALNDARGAFEAANGGSVFLDEIGELPLGIQPKLLRVLERREVIRLGAHRSIPLDVRVIAATHRDLQAMVAAGQFREDLYYRVSESSVWLPPLRERPEDIELLARHLIERDWSAPIKLERDALAYLERHAWPGNVREMRNVLRRACALAGQAPLDAELLRRVISPAISLRPGSSARVGSQFPPLEEEITHVSARADLGIAQATDAYRKEYMRHLCKQYCNDCAAIARHMGVHVKYARRLIRRYGLVESK